MTAPTPESDALVGYLRSHADEPNAWDGHGRADQLDSYRRSMLCAADALAAVTAERDDARREVEHQKWIKAKNTEVLTGQLDQARQKLADAPHNPFCTFSPHSPNLLCNCWKAGL